MSLFGDEEQGEHARELLRAVPPATLHDAITAVVTRGGLLSFSGSRDGFAVSVMVALNGEKERRWCDTTESFLRALEGLQRAADDPGREKAEAREQAAQEAAKRGLDKRRKQ